jgi:triosephosphate isomerase
MMRTTTLLYRFARNKRMIAGNWKSNKTQGEAVDFVKNTINTLKYNPDNVGIPSFIQTSSLPQSRSISLRSLP